MKKIISFAKNNLYFFFFGVFAVLFAVSFWYVGPSGRDAIFDAHLSSDGFFGAVEFCANDLGEGTVASFLCMLIAVCPLFVRRVLSFGLCTAALVLAARLPFARRPESDPEEYRKNSATLVFCAALFAVSGKALLKDTVFSISGTVHYVLPALLILVLVYLTEHSEDKKSLIWAFPVLTLSVAMLSYQAAVAALVIAVFYFIRVLRTKERSALRISLCGASLAILASCSVLYIIQGIGLPEDVSLRLAVRDFLASVLGYGGLFPALLIFMLFCSVSSLTNDIIPAVKEHRAASVSLVLRVMLCLLAASSFVVLIPHSALISAVKIPGIMIIPRLFITIGLAIAVFLIDMHCGTDRLSAPLVISAAAAILVSALTYTFGAAAYFIPLILVLPVLARLFVRIQTKRAATVIASGLCALYFAQKSVTPEHFISVAALLGAGAVIQASPLFRKRRIYETLAVLFVFVLFFMTNRWL